MVEQIFDSSGIGVKSVELGEVELEHALTKDQQKGITRKLEALGFYWVDDKRTKHITQIKSLVIDLVQNQNANLQGNLSEYLSRNLQMDYSYISNFFSEIEGVTIEKYFVLQKIEKVKELLVYDELSLGEIASLLQYSSTAYLSNQFKKITGLAPSHFKKIKHNKRISLDDL